MAPVAALSGASAASAATTSPSTAPAVVCLHLTGSATKDTGSLSGCTPAATGDTGTIADFLPTGGTVTWKNGTTTTYTATDTPAKKGCPAGSIGFKIKGKVTASTNKSIHKAAAVTMTVCNVSGTLENGKHTKVDF